MLFSNSLCLTLLSDLTWTLPIRCLLLLLLQLLLTLPLKLLLLLLCPGVELSLLVCCRLALLRSSFVGRLLLLETVKEIVNDGTDRRQVNIDGFL